MKISKKDALWNTKFDEHLKAKNEITLSPYEQKLLDSVESDLSNVNRGEWARLDNDIFFPKDKMYRDEDSIGTARCVGVVQASPEILLAWMYHVDSGKRQATRRFELRCFAQRCFALHRFALRCFALR